MRIIVVDTFESVAATSGLIRGRVAWVDTTHNKQLDLLTAAADLDSVRTAFVLFMPTFCMQVPIYGHLLIIHLGQRLRTDRT